MLDDNITNDATSDGTVTNNVMLKGAKNNKKKLIIAMVAVAIVIVAGASTVFVIKSYVLNKTKTTSITTVETKKLQDTEAEDNDSKAKTFELYKKAMAAYQASGNKQRVRDLNEQLCQMGETEYCKLNNHR